MRYRAIVRRLAGTASVLLLVALTAVALKTVTGPAPDSFRVEAQLGRAGSGLRPGVDVKARGVAIGRVVETDFRDGQAVAVLEIGRLPALPPPDQIELVVTAKTFLGEKQVELNFPPDAFPEPGSPDVLRDGHVLVASRAPVEVQEVLAAMEPFLAAIDGRDLAAIVEAFGEQQGEGERIARNIELGAELAAFGARTAPAQLDRLRSLADVADALAARVEDFNRLNRSLPRWVTLVADRPAAVRSNLDALSAFSIGLAELLEVEEGTIRDLMRLGDLVGAVFERRIDRIGEIVHGLYRYAAGLGLHGGDLTDGSEFGLFRLFVEGEDFEQQICDGLGPLAEQFPACSGGDGG